MYPTLVGAQSAETAPVILIKPKSTTAADTLEGSRFTVREEVARPSASPVSASAVTNGTTASAGIEGASVVKAKAVTTATPPPPPAAVVTTPVPAPKESDQAQESEGFEGAVKRIIMGGEEEDLSRYREGLHADDPRQNLVSVSIAPGLFYIDSKSDYWFRNFASDGPGLSVNADVWLTPFMGVGVDYFTTLSADLKAEPDNSRRILVDHRNLGGAIQFRRYYSMSRKAPSLTFGVGYNEYQLLIPKQETDRIRIGASGIVLSIHNRWPTGNYEAWSWGAELFPKLDVKEEATAATAKSGSLAAAYAVRFQVGKDYVFNRSSQVFWRLSHRFDKMVYEGSATVDDPITGLKPTGVTVTTGATLFEIGYAWGD